MNAAPATAGPWRDIDGIVLLDKQEGLTSNAALQRVRRAFRARKAGHTGSLDPLASGLLPLCLGQATKACGQLLDADKTYLFRLALGARTSTGDRAGEVIERRAVPPVDEARAREVAASFLGEIAQVPPMYSALKQAGQRLYRLARAGAVVERPARPVRIERLDLLAQGPDWQDYEVRCSKGTYVRTLAEDLAQALGSVGHVASLRRTALGPFSGAGMHTLAEVEEAATGHADLESMLLPADAALPGLPAVRLGEGEQASILQGRTVPATGPGAARVRIYGVGGRFLGVGRMSPEGARLAPERIMVEVPASPRASA